MAQSQEPHNPFYLVLLAVSGLFIVTIFAYLFVPMLEQKALEMGEVPPPSPFRDALRRDGWKWLLYEVAAMVFFGLLSMGVDRYRRWRQERAAAPTEDSAATKVD